MVSEGKFRDDLYYRLAVLEVPVAPLRQRREDIALLVHDRLAYEQQLAALPTPFEIEDKAITELAVYDWPGNIRQLHNVLSRLATRSDEGMPITAAAARSEIARFQPGTSNNQSTVAIEKAVLLPADCRMLLSGESMQDFINRLKHSLIESVRNSTGSMTHAANRLQCDRTALQKLLARLIANDNASEESTDQERALAA